MLKIDRSFVADVLSDDDSAALAGAIITLGHQLGLEVVAEGVETREQLEFLCHHGCDIAQGDLLAAPRVGSELPAVLENLAVWERDRVLAERCRSCGDTPDPPGTGRE